MINVTILMGAFNCESTIKEAIDSIIGQTYKHWKLVICNDCSTDDTLEILLDYQSLHSNIFVIQNEQNLGLAASLNHCLELVDTKYVARMDGDDISHPDRLQKQVEFLDNNQEFTVVSTAMELFDDTGVYGLVKVNQKPSIFDFRFGTPHCHAPMMMHSAALFEVKGYNSNLRRAQDYDLWSRLYALGYFGFNISEPLYSMRDDAQAKSRRSLRTRFDEVFLRYRIFKRLNFGLFDYIYCLKPLLPLFVPSFVYDAIRSRIHKK